MLYAEFRQIYTWLSVQTNQLEIASDEPIVPLYQHVLFLFVTFDVSTDIHICQPIELLKAFCEIMIVLSGFGVFGLAKR